MSDQPSSNIQTPPPEWQPSPPTGQKRHTGIIIALVIIILLAGAGAAYYFLIYSKEEADQNTNEVVNTELNLNSTTLDNQNVNLSLNNSSTNENANLNVGVDLNTNFQWFDNDTDTDADGLFNMVELWLETDINKADSDNDGYNDFEEIDACFSPLGAARFSINDFISYCTKILSDLNTRGVYVIPESEQESLCLDWSVYSQELIDEKISGVEAKLVDDEELMERTDQVVQVEGFYGDMMLIALSTCDTTGLSMVTWMFEEDYINSEQ